MTFAILAALLSSVFHPFMSGTAKKAAHPLTLNFWGCCVATIVFSFCYFQSSFWDRFLLHWPLIIISGFLHIAYVCLALMLIRKHEFQVLYPLTRLAPILILIGEILLLEAQFSWLQILGVLSVISGALIFGFDHKIKHVRKQVFLWILLITLFVTGFHLADKKLVAYFSPAEIWALVFTQLPILGLVLFWKPKEALEDLKHTKNLLKYSITMIGTWYFAVVALKELDAAVVASIRNVSILFGVFLGAHLFDEGHKLWRYAAAGLIVGGIGLVVL